MDNNINENGAVENNIIDNSAVDAPTKKEKKLTFLYVITYIANIPVVLGLLAMLVAAIIFIIFLCGVGEGGGENLATALFYGFFGFGISLAVIPFIFAPMALVDTIIEIVYLCKLKTVKANKKIPLFVMQTIITIISDLGALIFGGILIASLAMYG